MNPNTEQSLPIDRCVCVGVTFAAMNTYVNGDGTTTLDSLRARFKCGTGCNLCEPYVRAMLRTGRVRFAINDPDIQTMQGS